MGPDTLIEFPAELSVKAMGLNTDDFESLVSGLVLPLLAPQGASVSTLPSRGGKYLSVRIRFTATSLGQLETVYQALRSQERVLYTL